MLFHRLKGIAVTVLVGGSFAIGATTLARQFAPAPADLPGRVEIEHQSPELRQAPEDASAAPRVSLDEVKAALKRRREGIKSLFVRYEEEGVPLVDPALAFRWDIMRMRMKTEEHEAFEGTNRYRRTIHRGTAKALGDPTVVDPLSPKIVQERRREQAKKHRDGSRGSEGEGTRPAAAHDLSGPDPRLRSALRWTTLLEEVPPGLSSLPGIERARHIPRMAEPGRGLSPGDRPRHFGSDRGSGGETGGRAIESPTRCDRGVSVSSPRPDRDGRRGGVRGRGGPMEGAL